MHLIWLVSEPFLRVWMREGAENRHIVTIEKPWLIASPELTVIKMYCTIIYRIVVYGG